MRRSTRAPRLTATLPPPTARNLLSRAGISLKTQEMFLMVFVFRYLDLFTNFVSIYNTTMKLLYIGLSGYIVHMIRNREPWNVSGSPLPPAPATTVRLLPPAPADSAHSCQ